MKVYGAIRIVLYWITTALVLVFVTHLAEIEVLRHFIGGLMVFYGVEEILYTAVKNKKHYAVHSLYWNIVEIIIGFTLIVFVEPKDPEVTYAVVCVGWAIWSILREVRELVEITEELKEHKHPLSRTAAVVNILESLLVIALSLTMLIEPGEHHAKIHLYLLAVELFTKVTFPIVHYIAERLEERKHGKAKPQPALADGEVAACEEGRDAE